MLFYLLAIMPINDIPLTKVVTNIGERKKQNYASKPIDRKDHQ